MGQHRQEALRGGTAGNGINPVRLLVTRGRSLPAHGLSVRRQTLRGTSRPLEVGRPCVSWLL